MSQSIQTVNTNEAVKNKNKLNDEMNDVTLDIQNGIEYTIDDTHITLAYLIDADGNEFAVQKNIVNEEIEIFSIVDGVIFASYHIEAVAEYINENIQ